MPDTAFLTDLCKVIRRHIMVSSTAAGSGHPSSSLSAVELMAGLMFGRGANGPFFHYDPADPQKPNNDRLIFSKGHASPLFYALWAAAGQLAPEELKTFRKFTSPLEGHPTPRFTFTEAATGSLGQGLSILGGAWRLTPGWTNCPTAPLCCWATAKWPRAASTRPCSWPRTTG